MLVLKIRNHKFWILFSFSTSPCSLTESSAWPASSSWCFCYERLNKWMVLRLIFFSQFTINKLSWNFIRKYLYDIISFLFPALFKKMEEKEVQTEVKNPESKNTSNTITVSTQCKVCKFDFTESTIFKHVSHNTFCNEGYSNDEIQAFKSWKNQRDQLIRKQKHDPAKRRERYLRDKAKKFSCSYR